MKKIIKILVVVVIVLGVAVVWVKNPGDIQSKVRRLVGRGQVESKKFLKVDTARDVDKARACRQMLERIRNAKRAAEEKKGIVGATVTWNDVLPEMGLKEIPRCPSGGVYHLNGPLQLPSCSIANNGTPDTADDHIIHH